MHHLKPARLPIPRRRKMALVPALPLPPLILQRHIANLENLHRHRMMLVLPNRLQEPRQQRRPHNLILGCLWICQPDRRRAVIFAIEPREVLVVRAQDQRQHLGPAGHGGLEADDVAELVDGERRADGAGLRGKGTFEVVEAVGDRDVFHVVAGVVDVGAGRRDEEFDGGGGGERGGWCVGHFLEELVDVGAGEVDAAAGVDVGEVDTGFARGDVGGAASLVIVGGVDLDWFNAGIRRLVA